MSQGKLGFGGSVSQKHTHAPRTGRALSLRTPFGRIILARDKGSGFVLSREQFVSNVGMVHRNQFGKIIDVYDLGSGLVTNAGVNLLANDFAWATATLKRANFHRIGTGTTADAAADVYLQTPVAAGSLTGSTAGYMTGAQSYVSPNKYQTVATFTAAAGLAVTEWGLLVSNDAPVSRTATGTPTNNTFTDTGAGTAWSSLVGGGAGYTIEIGASTINTPTTTVMGQVLSATATVATIQGPSASSAWLTLANASASVPAANAAYTLFPTMWDHRSGATSFPTINMSTSDTLQVTYTLTCTSGG